MSNTGYCNTGYYNTGYCNTGYYNTGYYNTGYCNTGYYNTGYYNTGNYNTGDHNTGYCNTGYYNTGNYNTGNYNTGNYNTGDCNTNKPTVRLFNKDSEWTFYGDNHRKLRLILNRYSANLLTWVSTKDMTADEKGDNPSHKTTGGFLKYNKTRYNGKEVTKEDKEFLENVPNFCPKILEETTGIIFSNTKTITIDGKEIEISKESFEAFKKQFNDV